MARMKAMFGRLWRWLICALRGDVTWFRISLHVVVAIGLLVALGINQLADDYFNRGVASGTDLQPIPFTDVNPMGINTFLNEEVDPDVIEQSLDMVAAGGYGYIRQMFGWFEIEPEEDVYTDRDGNSTWDKFDLIVELANERNLEIIARLEKPPRWARWGQEDIDEYPDGPPNNLADWTNYIEQVVGRYKGKVTYFQIWNEPNLEGEWGGFPIDPEGYVELLKAAAETAREVNPDAVILLAGLAPTEQTGPHNLSDLLFLQEVYDAGGADYFDIVTAMVYGYGYSPYDRRVEFARNNFSRPIQTREIMVRNGDADKPVWAAEYGWVSLPNDWDGDASPWGEPVSRGTQADYLVEGYLRAQREWPWMGVMNVWTFRFERPPDHEDEIGNPTRGFAIVEYDFNPYPAYTALKEFAGNIQLPGTGAYLTTPEQQQLTSAGKSIDLTFRGQTLEITVDSGSGGYLVAGVDGRRQDRIRLTPRETEQLTVMANYPDDVHTVQLHLQAEPGANPPVITGYVIAREPVTSWIFPWLNLLIFIGLLLTLLSLGWAIWDWRRQRGPAMDRSAEDLDTNPETIGETAVDQG